MSFRLISSEGAMLNSLCIRLEARSAAHRCFRAYEIELGTDLFGAWMVEMSYGRIGALGRTKVRSFSTTEQAQAQVRTCLRKRATAPRRIGVAYRVRRTDGCTTWLPPELADPHGAWFAATRDQPWMNDLP
jgi:predicted DNA-binding WGR domain protein